MKQNTFAPAIVCSIFCLLFFGTAAVAVSVAQTTAISYQGRLSDLGAPANGDFEIQFKLYDALAGGTQIGGSVTETVTATNGVFSAAPDFGAAPFAAGADRFLEIAVRPASSANPFTVLTPRQPVRSAPYSIRSRTAENAAQLGGLDATRFVQQDAAGNVAIGGNLTVAGTATYDTVNAATQYNLGGNRILSAAGGQNLFVGLLAGRDNSTGSFNTFTGSTAGMQNTSGEFNSFFGANSGRGNTTGAGNSFFGEGAGFSNAAGGNNAFFGRLAGFNSTANNNAFFGAFAGYTNTAGSGNAFFGFSAGYANTTGSFNSFFGAVAGGANTGGAENSFFGDGAGASNTTGNYNTFLGRQAGLANTTGINNTFAGRFAGQSNTSGNSNSFFGFEAGKATVSGSNNAFFGALAGTQTTGAFNAFFGSYAGGNNTTGSGNAFFGEASGAFFTSGAYNTFVGNFAGSDFFNPPAGIATGNRNTALGFSAGRGLLTGNDNTFLGSAASGANNLNYATALGAGSFVNSNDTIVLGKTAGTYNGVVRPADTVRIPGLLSVSNIIESSSGGFKFPDGTIQTTASTGGGSGGIFNQTTLQTGANFNIDGIGRASVFAAEAQFNIGGNRVLSNTGTNNLFAGAGAGANNTGINNSFFGYNAGFGNLGASGNTFFGSEAGLAATTGGGNVFVGIRAGYQNTTGQTNVAVGYFAGEGNTTGRNNIFIGNNARPSVGDLTNATAIGNDAVVAQSNSLILGRVAPVSTQTTSVGIGTTAPQARLEVADGDILLSSPGRGVILKSPDGLTCRRLSIDDTGAMVLAAIACP